MFRLVYILGVVPIGKQVSGFFLVQDSGQIFCYRSEHFHFHHLFLKVGDSNSVWPCELNCGEETLDPATHELTDYADL